jgi:Papain family cysteine protease
VVDYDRNGCSSLPFLFSVSSFLYLQAFTWINGNGGICSEAAYPYTGTDGTCHACTSVAGVASHTDVTPNSDDALTTAVAQQPVSIAVEADQSSFQFYSSGVMTAACGTNLDHGVLAVGYDTTTNPPSWKVKNSWGADWGMSGYILLGKGASYNSGAGQCGIYSVPSWPTYGPPGAQPSIAPQPSSGPSHDSTSGGGTPTSGGSTTGTKANTSGSTSGSSGSSGAGAKLAAKMRATKH